MNERFRVYLPPQYRGTPRFDAGPMMRHAEMSRPAYRVLDFAQVAEGNNSDLPHHCTALIVADRLDYLTATRKARELNAQPGAQRALELANLLRSMACQTQAEVCVLEDKARTVRAAFDELQRLASRSGSPSQRQSAPVHVRRGP